MKILHIGATGTIGKKVKSYFSNKHTVITAGRNNADMYVDVENKTSIEEMYQSLNGIDAVISTFGSAWFGPLQEMNEELIAQGLSHKLMGQVNLVLLGQKYINDFGSFTLTTGIAANDPVKGAASLAITNGALNSFVLAASRELERGIRINAISPDLVEDSPEHINSFPGHIPVSMEKVVNAYGKSVLGNASGNVHMVRETYY